MIAELKSPRNVSELKSLVGLASYYRKCIKDFGSTVKCLHDLTRKNQKWVWDEMCEVAFQTIKQKLISAPILGYPCAEGGIFILDTDASNFSIGSVLSQMQGGP